MHKARQAYVQEHEPAKYGTAMENFNDSRIKENVPVQTAPSYNKVGGELLKCRKEVKGGGGGRKMLCSKAQLNLKSYVPLKSSHFLYIVEIL